MDAPDKTRELAGVAKEIAGCRRCGLCAGRTNAVPGEGDAGAAIMFIGEGPGFYEDRQGRPFVGASGKFLDELLASIGLDRRRVYITNIVKCRPPDNRDPQPEEIEACSDFLQRQIEIITPKVVVTLGRHSMQRYFPGESIGRVHGQPRRKGELIVVPMYHPAAALHQGSLRKVIEADFSKLPALLQRALGTAAAPEPTAPVPAHLRKGAPEPAPAEAAAAAQPSAPDSSQMRLL
jgi:DNA polymerase